MNPPLLLAIGGAHIDRRGRSFAPFRAGVSNPGTMREEAGGAAFNALRTARLFGVSGTMLAPRGGDAAGRTVASAFAEAGIGDIGPVHLDRMTPSYTALIGHDGELAGAIADMELYETAFSRIAVRTATRSAIDSADALLVDANIPAPALKKIVGYGKGKPVFANAISPAKAPRLIPVLSDLRCLFVNAREAASLTGQLQSASSTLLLDGLQKLGARAAILTRGPDGIEGFDGFDRFRIKAPRVKVVDETGAGDALCGATIAGLMFGLALAEAARHGIAAAALVIGEPFAAAGFSHEQFEAMLARTGSAITVQVI